MPHTVLNVIIFLSVIGKGISLLKTRETGNEGTWKNVDAIRRSGFYHSDKVPAKSRLHLKGKFIVQLSTITKSSSIILPGSSFTLHCKLRGRHKQFAVFIWEKDGMPLIASSRRHIRTRLRSERLRIKPVHARDAGKYRCIAVLGPKRFYSLPVKISIKGSLSSGNGFQERSGTHTLERCEPYRGSICTDNLNSKELVFISSNENQNEIEAALRDNIRHVTELISPECYASVLRALCVSLFPPCRHVNATARPMRICKESCMQIQRSHCSRGLLLLRHMKLAHTILDGQCDRLPEIDSNEICARVSPPGSNYKNMLCKQKFRLQALHHSSIAKNIVEKATGINAICANASWLPLNRNTKHLLKSVFRNLTFVTSGQYAKLAKNLLCFQIDLKLSDLVKNRTEYNTVRALPRLNKIEFDTRIKGFSIKLKNNIVKQLTVPIGSVRRYYLDKKLFVPNVTVYYREEKFARKLFAEGTLDLCGTEFKIRVEQSKHDVTLLSGHSAHPIDLSTVELAFGLRQPTKDIIAVMKQFQMLKLRLTSPKLRIIWDNGRERAMLFSGKSYHNRWGNAEVNVEFLLGQDRSFWAAAFTTRKRSFKDIFSILTGMKHLRLAKLLDMSLDIDKVGLILATKDVKIPRHGALRFQYEPAASISTRAIANGLSLEARANVKSNCKRNDNRSFICQLVQFATGNKATTRIQMKNNMKGLKLVLKFYPDGEVPGYSINFIKKMRDIWNKIDPFSRVPGTNVEVVENPDMTWRSEPRYHGLIWLRQLEIYVRFMDVDTVFERSIVYVTGDVVVLNKRYTYKIKDVGLSYCLRLLDSITETLKQCKQGI
eukprot:gene8976-9934_t